MKTTPTLPAVCVEALSKSVGDSCLLSNVSFTLPPGSTLLLFGRQGSGKTILLKLLMGLVPLSAGKIWLSGHQIDTLPEAELQRVRRTVGFGFQNAALFASLSVTDNIAFPLRYGNTLSEAEVRTTVDALLEELGLEGVAHKKPFELSRGAQKLAAFARALARTPTLLLLDDPWSDNDPSTVRSMRSVLLARKRTHPLTCLITENHAPVLLEPTDQIAVLQDTRLTHFRSLLEARGNPAAQQYLAAFERGD